MALAERVLVVEDDDDIREVMQDVLASEGFRVDVARDGFDALDKLDVGVSPPVILLDMMMPNMDGETFLKIMRDKPGLANAPVIIVSGNAAARDKALKLHAAACLVKPFELEELLSLVRRLTHPHAP